VAIFGSFMGDQLWFYLGRRHGSKLLDRYPRYAAPAARARQLLAKYDTPVILSLRFLYGLRTVLPFVIGMSSIPALRFQALNLAGAALWSILGAGTGYLFGNAVEVILGDIHQYEKYVLAVIALAGLGYWWYSERRRV
jgi:membrane protein DedA with SNARE-associated domain